MKVRPNNIWLRSELVNAAIIQGYASAIDAKEVTGSFYSGIQEEILKREVLIIVGDMQIATENWLLPKEAGELWFRLHGFVRSSDKKQSNWVKK